MIAAKPRIKEVFSYGLGRQGAFGGIKFDINDDAFDSQPAAGMQPRAILAALEVNSFLPDVSRFFKF